MKYKCRCGKTHNFKPFRKQKRSWGGVTSYYQYFCKDLDKLMILETTTYPNKLTSVLCPNVKKYNRLSRLLTSDEIMM